jgi:hypothetical protein
VWCSEVLLNLDDCEGGCGLQDVDGSFVLPGMGDAPVSFWEVRGLLIQVAHLHSDQQPIFCRYSVLD